mgnify:CR=1 FL=1
MRPMALSLVPALTARLPVKTVTANGLSAVGNRMLNWYQRSLHFALDKAWWVFIVSMIAAAAAISLYNYLNNELMPTEDRGSVRIFARGPDGVGLNFMDRQADKMEDILLPYVNGGDIDSIYTVVGQWDPNLAFITVPLKHWDERSRSQQEIINEIRGPLAAIPGAPARAFGANSLNLRGQGGGLELALTGQSYDEIFAAAQSFARIVQQQLPGFGMPRISYQPTQPQLRVNIDRRRAQELGVPLTDIATTLRVAINGDDLADLNVGDQAIPIILQAQTQKIQTPADLANLYVGATNGSLVPLSSLAYISEEGVAAELERQAQRRAIELDMELPPEMPLQQAVAAPRFHHQLLPKDQITMEPYSPLTAEVQQELTKKGYKLSTQGWSLGDVQAIQVTAKEVKAAADPRSRGVAKVIQY